MSVAMQSEWVADALETAENISPLPPSPPKSSPDKKQKTAIVTHPLIEAVVSEMFDFDSHDQALKQLRSIRRQFITLTADMAGSIMGSDDKEAAEAKEILQPPSSRPESVVLWIKGYAITRDEEKAGHLGNVAQITTRKIVRQSESGESETRYSLFAEKIALPLEDHPQRKEPKRQHPNWAHSVLRSVRQGKVYNTPDEARKVLETFHREFSGVSIPGQDKLGIIVYSRSKERQLPIQKIVLRIVMLDEGVKCKIDWNENGKGKGLTGGSKKQKGAAADASTMLAAVFSSGIAR